MKLSDEKCIYTMKWQLINEEHYEQGIKEGTEKGIKKGKIGIAKNLLSINLPL